jgi:hypothetical protein
VSDEVAESVGDEPVAGQVEQSGYKPKPPLWQPNQEERSLLASVVGGVVLLIVTVAVLAVGLEKHLLSAPIGQLEVTVVHVEATVERPRRAGRDHAGPPHLAAGRVEGSQASRR